MSNWTHVASIARIDDMRLDENDVMDFKKIFGKEVNCCDDWDDYEEHPEEYLPCGSEGSLHMSVWVNPNISHIPAYTVSIFGDLRDHDSCDEIIDWFKSKLDELPVRSAVMQVDNEWYGSKTYVYEEPVDEEGESEDEQGRS